MAVAVRVRTIRDNRQVLVHLPVAVVVFTVADLRCVRIDLLIVVVAVSARRGIVLRQAAVHGVAGAHGSDAVAVVVVVVFVAAAAVCRAEEGSALTVAALLTVSVRRVRPDVEVDAAGHARRGPTYFEDGLPAATGARLSVSHAAAEQFGARVDDAELAEA